MDDKCELHGSDTKLETYELVAAVVASSANAPEVAPERSLRHHHRRTAVERNDWNVGTES